MSLTLPVPEAAAYLGLSERTVWRRIRSGALSTQRSGRRLLVRVEAAGVRRVAEAGASYEAGPLPDVDPLIGPWPWTVDKVALHRQRLREQRLAAIAELDRIASETRPDPEGLTSVDYLREWRDPDWEPEEGDGDLG